MASKLKIPSKKQLPTKNFMSPTISAAIKAAVPKRKILAERNETLDVEQTSLLRSSSFGSKAVKFPAVDADDDVEKDFVAKSSVQPYDPIENYLSPRPKFLRYNPDRRRKIFVLQENEDSVKSSSSYDAGIPSSGLELGADSSGCIVSSQKESVEEAEDMIDKEGETEDDEEDKTEEEMVEFGEDSGWGLKDFLKFLLVVIALISTTQGICLMNSPTPSHTLEAVWSFNDWYGKTRSNVYGAVCLNFSEVARDPTREADLVVGRLKEGEVYHEYERLDMVETIEELVEVQHGQIDGVYQDEVVSKDAASDLLQGLGTPNTEVENDETDVIQDEMWSKQEDTDHLQWIEILQEHEIAASEVIEIHNVEAEREVHDQLFRADFNQDGVSEEEDSDANEKNSQLTTDAECEITKDMEDALEETDDADVLIRLASSDLIIAVLIGLPILILTSLGVMHHSNRMKSSSTFAITVAQENNMAEKEEIKDLEPSPNPSSLIQQIDEPLVNSASLVVHPPQKDVSKEISRIHAPSVELLGEFVFGAEADARNSLIQATTVSSGRTKSSHLETSTEENLQYTAEKTVKKQRHKNAEVSSMVTPSPVRRSSRIQNRSVMSP